MDNFPLAPFLASLSAERIHVTLGDYDRISLALRTGGPWTLERLRGVLLALLVHSPDQEAIFLDKFDSFFFALPEITSPTFTHDTEAAMSTEDGAGESLDVMRMRGLLTEPPGGSTVEPQPESEPQPGREQSPRPTGLLRRYRWLWLMLAAILLLAMLGILLPHITSRSSGNQNNSQVNANANVNTNDNANPGGQGSGEQYVAITPQVEPPTQVPLETDWRSTLNSLGLGLLVLALAHFCKRVWERLKSEESSEWNEEGPRYFRLGSIGGDPQPLLDASSLDQMADSLSYFRSEEPSDRLNDDASVKATTSQGGIPTLIFHKRKRLRRVYVLEDAYARPLDWNNIARELAAGLEQRGIPVIFGRYYGSLAQFQASDESNVWLDSLEDQHRDCLLFIFSDGKSLKESDDLLLDSLSNWLKMAWMDLREPRFWDQSTRLVASYDIPVYPATKEGILLAMERFATERAPQKDYSGHALKSRDVAPFQGSDLYTYLERFLGDALPWAQACAMMQPCTLGMADALRLKFLPHLPAERIERLFRLPGTVRTVAGLRFSKPVLAVLRSSFVVRWTKYRQEELLYFLLGQISLVEPEQKDSLAHLTWEWIYERVNLELEPDKALHRLAQLVRTPLANSIQAELENIGLPNEAHGRMTSTQQLIPLRQVPDSKEALLKLNAMAPHVRVRGARTFRLKNALRQIYALERNLRTAIRLETEELAGTVAHYTGITRLASKFLSPWNTQSLKTASWLALQIRIPGSITGKTNIPDPITDKAILPWWKSALELLKQPRARLAEVGLLCVGLLPLLLSQTSKPNPFDWINRIFNNPPRLVRLDVAPTSLPQIIQLQAIVDDPDGDAVSLSWQVPGYVFTGNGNTVTINTSQLNTSVQQPDSIPITVRLTDARGGKSEYTTKLQLVRTTTNSPTPAGLLHEAGHRIATDTNAVNTNAGNVSAGHSNSSSSNSVTNRNTGPVVRRPTPNKVRPAPRPSSNRNSNQIPSANANLHHRL
jgi:hypothetical protein